MRECGTVAEAHERVHRRARVDHDLDLLVRQPEEEVRLDQLEALVRERGGVDGDLRAHVPRRVRERLRRCHVFELVTAVTAERTSGGRQYQRVNLLGCTSFEALERCRVLAVDRDQAASATPLRRQGQLARSDEALLVREREVHPAFERPQGRGQAGEADDGVEDEIGLGPLEQLREVSPDLGQRGQAVDRLRARGGRTELELGARVDDFQRLAPN